MKLVFVVGHVDTPEAYWRVALPARHFHAPMVLVNTAGAEARAFAADTLWVHQPTGPAGADLVERAAAAGRRVIVDMSEDPWLRGECGKPYLQIRLDSCERALRAAGLIVVANSALAPAFERYGEVAVVETALPLDGWEPQDPEYPPILGWWSDGRQKLGIEALADQLTKVLDGSDAALYQMGAPNSGPFARRHKSRIRGILGGNEGAEVELIHLKKDLAKSFLSLEHYPSGAYQQSIGDVALLRAAALGVPTVTTRGKAPPGSLNPSPAQWAETILRVIQEPGERWALSLEARAWAESRASFAVHERILEA